MHKDKFHDEAHRLIHEAPDGEGSHVSILARVLRLEAAVDHVVRSPAPNGNAPAGRKAPKKK